MVFLEHLFTFRNDGHMYWFYGVTTIVLLNLVFLFFGERKKSTALLEAVFVLSLGFTFPALRTSLEAIRHVARSINYSVYSPDCIWFNALTAITFLCIGVSAHMLERKLSREDRYYS